MMNFTRHFSLVLVFIALLVMPAFSGETVNQQEEEQKETFDAHRSYIKIHFDDQEMDFAFQWILGSISGKGCELGEALYVASRIEDGNPASWQKQWEKMGKRVETRAEQSLKNGHKVSARNSYQRASNYYRTALVSMLPDNPRFNSLAQKTRECLKKAGALYEPEIEYIEIPFEDTVLPGYYWKADESGGKCK
ncbi:MAG: alpha/beta hydrolase, partial [Vulcanimicrobiota bacterium]